MLDASFSRAPPPYPGYTHDITDYTPVRGNWYLTPRVSQLFPCTHMLFTFKYTLAIVYQLYVRGGGVSTT